MAGDAKWLIEAIEQKQLVEFHDTLGYCRTFEPHVYALGAGAQEIVIAYQIDVGSGTVENERVWKTVDASKVSRCEPTRHFSETRPIPKEHAQRVRTVYAQASTASRSRKE